MLSLTYACVCRSGKKDITYSVDTVSVTGQNLSKVLMHEADDIIRIVNLTCLAEIIGVFGIAANIVNIRVFRRMGYRDGVNVTLTFLAVSDTAALLVQQIYNILVLPAIRDTDLNIVKKNLLTKILYWNEYFIRVSCFITSLASFERCLCVVLPLKAKRLFTANVSIVTNVSVFMVLSLYLFPTHYAVYFDWKFFPDINRTILSMVYHANGENILQLSYYFTDLLLPYSSFSILIVCSATIYIKLRSKAKWRQSISSSGALTGNSNKERKIGVMLMTISIICVSFLLPKAVYLTALGVVRELKSGGAYHNVALITISFASLLETINCSITIFVYYKMSTKYRAQLNTMFHKVVKSPVKKWTSKYG
ncbi:hypothetical protein Btru_056110 [Bulinus truncatus]|nr:hypothetical protein Btru_056110 [Bulinus truncatus]